MTIETKYNIGDEVWTIYQHQAIKLHIDGIKTYTNSKRTVAEYKLVYKPVQSSEYDILCADVEIQESFLEQHLFPTKEELLKSL